MAEGRHAVTKQGLLYRLKVDAGIEPEFTRIVAGAGRVEEALLEEQTAVSEPICEMSAGEREVRDGSCLAIPCRLTSSHVEQTVFVTQIGVYANDPEEGEILYQLQQFRYPQPVASLEANGGAEDIWEHELLVYITNADSAAAPVDPNYQVSRQEFSEHKGDPAAHPEIITAHNTAPDAHPDLRQLIADIPAPDVSGDIAAHNGDGQAHGDIRTAIAAKAAPSRSVAVTLTAAGWTGGGPYTQTVSVEGVTAATNGFAGLSPAAGEEQGEAFAYAQIYQAGQAAGTVTFTARGDRPELDIPLTLLIVG